MTKKAPRLKCPRCDSTYIVDMGTSYYPQYYCQRKFCGTGFTKEEIKIPCNAEEFIESIPKIAPETSEK